MAARSPAGAAGRRGGAPAAALSGYARELIREGAGRIVRADQAVMSALPARRTARGIALARAMSAMAEPGLAGTFLAGAVLTAVRRRGWQAAALPAVAVPSGVCARWLLCELIARPRPPSDLWLAEPEGYSLPSRHTTMAVLTAGALADAGGVSGPARYALPLLAAAGVGASRVYLGVHWPSDVLAGWLFAAAWLGLAELAVAYASPSHPPMR
jgi:membrane-associated phospholipid phosphatase